MAKAQKTKARPASRSAIAAKRTAAAAAPGPVTLTQARSLAGAGSSAGASAAARGPAGRSAVAAPSSPATVGAERRRLEVQRRRERRQRERDYKATLAIMKQRGVKGLPPVGEVPPQGKGGKGRKGKKAAKAAKAGAGLPLQIFAEGDSWFDYPVPFFGGGIVPRLEGLLGVPILNLAKAGDEVRYMLGVEERKVLAQHLLDGCPAGGPWDVLLFSGGGNDIVDNPMALWIRDFDAAIPLADHIHRARFDAALMLVRAGYEDLIALRDQLSPDTRLIFHAYDFALPDGRGICNMGPWLKPTFDLRKFPPGSSRAEVVKAMLKEFAALLAALEKKNKGVTFINGQGTLAPQPSSWHNELHPSRDGFKKFAVLFHDKLKELFPGRVLA